MTVGMQPQDQEGTPTRLSTWIKISSAVVGVLSVLAIIPATLPALLSPMMCGGGCSFRTELAARALMATPFLLIFSIIAARIGFRRPHLQNFAFAAIPFLIVLAIFLVPPMLGL
ncbi:MAG TPA: hypothetical protein VGE65_05585 [Sphingobium sp.]